MLGMSNDFGLCRFENSLRLRLRHCWKIFNELGDRVTPFQVIEERTHRYARARETGNATLNFRIDCDNVHAMIISVMSVMTYHDLQRKLHQNPFQPFRIRLYDDMACDVTDRWMIMMRSQMRFELAQLSLALFLVWIRAASAAPTTAPSYQPTSSYTQQTIGGWKVMIGGELATDHPDLEKYALELLRVKLFDIARVVPPEPLRRLREVTLWLEYDDKAWPCACYHPSADWLRDNGFNPDKVKGVEIANAANFLTWSVEQPWMVLHELAHSYHDRVLGFDDPDVKAAYVAAVKSHAYDAILRINGHIERAYAMNNEQEYFAEDSEAFFGTNDFYPFVRAELQQHDPRMFELLKRVWRDNAGPSTRSSR